MNTMDNDRIDRIESVIVILIKEVESNTKAIANHENMIQEIQSSISNIEEHLRIGRFADEE